MSHVIVAAAMWAMLVACLFRLRARGRSAIPALTAASIAVSQTINIDWINLHLDDLLGDVGLSNMTMMTFFVVGIFLLGENLKAATGGRAFQPPAWVVLSVVLAVQTVSFFAINGRASTVHFTSTYGDQVATLIYSQSHFLYFGATLATVGVAVLRSGVLALPGAQRVGFGILLGASGVASIESLVIITRDLAGVIHAPSVYDAAEEIYKLLLPVVALAIATGLSIPPVVAAIKSRRASISDERLLEELDAMRADLSTSIADNERPPWLGGAELHRLVVEIQDILFTSKTQPSGQQRRLLELAETRVMETFKAFR